MRRKCGGKRRGVKAWICHGQIKKKKKQARARLEDCVIGVLLFFLSPPPSILFPFFYFSIHPSLPPLTTASSSSSSSLALFEVYLTCDECSNFIWIDKGPVTCSLTPATDLEGDERNEGKREEGWKKEGNGRGRRCLRMLATTAGLFSHFGAINSHRIRCLCS